MEDYFMAGQGKTFEYSTKNVKFSPVVSQLRYPAEDHSRAGRDSGFDEGEGIQRVTCQVQQGEVKKRVSPEIGGVWSNQLKILAERQCTMPVPSGEAEGVDFEDKQTQKEMNSLQKNRNLQIIGSLEILENKGDEGTWVNNKEICGGGVENGKNKRNSKSFLQWISFGKLGGSEKKGSKDKKRSSCPPLGHPLLTKGGIEETNGWKDGDGKLDEVDEQIINLTIIDKDSPPCKTRTSTPATTPTKPPKSTPSRTPKKTLPQLHLPDDSEDELSINFERIIEGIFNSDLDSPKDPLQPGQFTRQTGFRNYPPPPRVTQKAATMATTSFRDNFYDNPADESFTGSMEQKLISCAPPQLNNNNNCQKDCQVSPETITKAATIPVTGKPPKPPSSSAAQKYYGLRPQSGSGRPPCPPRDYPSREAMMELAQKLVSFREELHRSREQIALSHSATLESIHLHQRTSTKTAPAIDPLCGVSLPPSPARTDSTATTTTPPRRASTTYNNNSPTCGVDHPKNYSHQETVHQPVNQSVHQKLKQWESQVSRAKQFLQRPQQKTCERLLETDLDSTFTTLTGAEDGAEKTERRRRLRERIVDSGDGDEHPHSWDYYQDRGQVNDRDYFGKVSVVKSKACSLQNLSGLRGESERSESEQSEIASTMATLKPAEPGGGAEDRSRSMEFLLDTEKNEHLRAPENTLQKTQTTHQAGGSTTSALGERRMSEHELRIQRSLQKLNVPDWYKNYATSTPSSAAGTPSKTPRDFGSGTGLAGGWPGLSSSKTNSLTSLQSAGRYSGSKTGFGNYGSRHRTTTPGGRSSRESLMSPSSTASASPSPNFERSSFTYGMPYALTRFAAARMSCGASPASLSPSPSPVGGVGCSSTSTPVSSGPAARYQGYQKQPYLGWRSQERLASKSLYRSPAERLAADILQQQKAKQSTTPVATPQTPQPPSPAQPLDPPVVLTPPVEVNRTSPTKSNVTSATASDLSLNNSEESNSHKLNRVRSSIKEVSNAIVDYVNETKPLDDSMNGRASPRRGFVWLESSFVGTKPIDSPSTPDTPSQFIGRGASARSKEQHFKFEPSEVKESSSSGAGKQEDASSTSHYTSYISRNEQMEERSASSSVSSPTLEDILDSLLALRRPNKKFRSKQGGKGHESATSPTPPTTTSTSSTYKPSSTAGGATEEDISSSHYYYSSSSNTTGGATYGGSSVTDDITSSSTRPHEQGLGSSSPVKTLGSSSTTSEIYSSTSATRGSSYQKSYQSDWQERMNQPLPDAVFSSTTTSADTLSKYEASSPSAVSSSVVSSVQSTPTHQQYRSSTSGGTKDYYTSSCQSSPAKSILGGNHQSNELVDSRYRLEGSRGRDTTEEDELAFGTPTEILRSGSTAGGSPATSSSVAPLQGGVIVNPLTGLADYSNPPTPARHRRVSFDLDFSDKEEKSSSRSRNKEESVGGSIQCRNSKCGRTATGLEARREFKVCHNCNAYYCSRECRRAHWEKHKKTCMQSRVGAICKQIISHVKEDSYVMNQLSTTAKRGFLAKGRGCVKLFFNSPDRAERFLTGGLPELPEPLYIPHSDMLPEEMGAQTFSELSDQCRSYNAETRFVLYACVCVVNEVPTYGAVKWERELISRSSKLRLLLPRQFFEENQRHHHAPANPAHLMSSALGSQPSSTSPTPDTHLTVNGTGAGSSPSPLYDSVPVGTSSDLEPPPLPPHSQENDTLILRSVPPPSSHQLTSAEQKRLREVSFANIRKHLLVRGVDIKSSYPDIFAKLCRYVDHDEPFLPVTIYPKNAQTGKQFVCVIMPECSDSECQGHLRSQQDPTIAAAVASAAAFSAGGWAQSWNRADDGAFSRPGLQRVETINISEPGDDDDDHYDLT